MSRARILFADDHRMVVEGMSKLLEQEYELLDTAQDGLDLLEKIGGCKPDVVVLDVSMPRLNGLEAARRIHAAYPYVKLVFLSMHTHRMYVTEAFRAGASAYVCKQAAASELLRAIGDALGGRTYVTSGLLPVKTSAEPEPEDRTLTPRQVEVLQCVAQGLSAKEIATRLGVSPKTVEFHKARIMEKLGQRTTAELTRYALVTGIIEG